MGWGGVGRDGTRWVLAPHVLTCSPDLLSHSIVTSWIEMRTVQSEKANLMILFDKYLPVCLEKLKSGFKKITPVPEVTVIQTVLYLLDCLLTPQTTPPDSPRELYELYFIFACIWAFGGAMFQDQVRPPAHTCPLARASCPASSLSCIPLENTKATTLDSFSVFLFGSS